jgi:hypothetical protein
MKRLIAFSGLIRFGNAVKTRIPMTAERRLRRSLDEFRQKFLPVRGYASDYFPPLHCWQDPRVNNLIEIHAPRLGLKMSFLKAAAAFMAGLEDRLHPQDLDIIFYNVLMHIDYEKRGDDWRKTVVIEYLQDLAEQKGYKEGTIPRLWEHVSPSPF